MNSLICVGQYLCFVNYNYLYALYMMRMLFRAAKKAIRKLVFIFRIFEHSEENQSHGFAQFPPEAPTVSYNYNLDNFDITTLDLNSSVQISIEGTHRALKERPKLAYMETVGINDHENDEDETKATIQLSNQLEPLAVKEETNALVTKNQMINKFNHSVQVMEYKPLRRSFMPKPYKLHPPDGANTSTLQPGINSNTKSIIQQSNEEFFELHTTFVGVPSSDSIRDQYAPDKQKKAKQRLFIPIIKTPKSVSVSVDLQKLTFGPRHHPIRLQNTKSKAFSINDP